MLKDKVKALMLEYAKILHEEGTSPTNINGILHEILHEVVDEVMVELKEKS